MISTIIAKRYAKALFFIAKEEGKLESYNSKLQGLSAFLEKNPDVEATLVSPVYPADLKRSVLDEVIRANGITGVLANFLGLLVERRRIQHVKQILDAFRELMDEEMGVVRAVVRTPVPLPEDLRKKLTDVLTKASGKQVMLQLQEDPGVIGGVVAHIGDTVWDGSIRSQLQGLKESIVRGELG